MTRALFIVFAVFLSPAVLAQQADEGQNRPQRFQDMKQRMLDRVEQRMGVLQNAKSCIEQAQNPEALKACRPEPPQGAQGNAGGQPSGKFP